ncbi:MCE family protein [Pseudonocardiaceae bacterium YIM PH 21723]|nr:MCE family protein [Pseudonocardiaceae bacterium YIM PH 21723]
MSRALDRRAFDKSTLIKLGVFSGISLLCGLVVFNTLAQPVAGSTKDYSAEFTDVMGLTPGSDVRIAGIRVGRVTHVKMTGSHPTVDFEVTEDQFIPSNAEAAVRYADMLGARYITITRPPGQAPGELEEDAVIPLARTQPALDLTDLLNGFKPLFTTLDRKQVNQLAGRITAVFQGEGGNINSLMTHLASVMGTLKNKDQVIGDVVTNLNTVIGTTAQYREDLKKLIGSMGTLAHEASANREQIGQAIDNTNQLTLTINDLFRKIHPNLNNEIRSLNTVTETLIGNQDKLNVALKDFPELLKNANRKTDYGSWMNIYICSLTIHTPNGKSWTPGSDKQSGACQ